MIRRLLRRVILWAVSEPVTVRVNRVEIASPDPDRFIFGIATLREPPQA